MEVPALLWWLSGKEYACQCRRPGFDLWAWKIPWRRKWQHLLWYSCLENPWTEESGGLKTIGVAKSWTQLSD